MLRITKRWHSWGNPDRLIVEGRAELPFQSGSTDASTYWVDYKKGRRNPALSGQAYNLVKKEPTETVAKLVPESGLYDHIELVEGDFDKVALGIGCQHSPSSGKLLESLRPSERGYPMKIQTIGLGALVGGLLIVPMVSVMYLADKGLDLPFPPYDFFDWIARILPGPVVTFGIDLMIDSLEMLGLNVAATAKTAEHIQAILAFATAGIVATIIVYSAVGRQPTGSGPVSGLLVGAVLGLPIAIISASMAQSSTPTLFAFLWVLGVFCVWGVATVATARILLPEYSFMTLGSMTQERTRSVEVVGRRQFLVKMGAAAATITVAGAGLGRVLEIGERNRLEAELERMNANLPQVATAIDLPNENDPITPALGTRPEYTAVRDHYKVFIRSEPTVIDGATWTLPITGLVDNPADLTLEDLMTRYDARNEFVTLSCISNRVGGSLIGTTHWTGASLQDILADVRPQSGARYLLISSGDGFYETVDLDLIHSDDRVMLAYSWDGKPIPFDHGFPLRIWLPDRFGMKQPKWITGIEVIGEYREGYWVERGWSKEALVKATSVVDTVAVDSVIEDGSRKLVPIGGIAYAGARGISKVEVRLDNEPEWREAELRTPLSDAAWVIWRYDWPFEEGRHDFQVRCVEADGTPQVEEEGPPRPDGASGIHTKSETVEPA